MNPVTKLLLVLLASSWAFTFFNVLKTKESENSVLQDQVETLLEHNRNIDSILDKELKKLVTVNKKLESLSVLRTSQDKKEAAKLDVFSRHNLTNLAYRKPGLIEVRINKGTRDVFNEISKNSTVSADAGFSRVFGSTEN